MGSQVSSIELTPEFFEDLRKYTEFQDILRDLDIADEDQLDLFDTLDVDGGGTIDLEELITGISKLRGDARRSDIVGVGLIVRAVQLAVNDFQIQVMDKLGHMTRQLHAIESAVEDGFSPLKASRSTNSGAIADSKTLKAG